MTALGPARGLHARPAAERGDLDPRVVREHPPVGRPTSAAVARLDARVVDVVTPSSAGSRRAASSSISQSGKRVAQLGELARVRRAERRPSTAPSHADDVVEIGEPRDELLVDVRQLELQRRAGRARRSARSAGRRRAARGTAPIGWPSFSSTIRRFSSGLIRSIIL